MSYSHNNLPYTSHNVAEWEADAVTEALREWPLSGGELIESFESALGEATKAPYVVALSSGTAALHCALVAADVKRDDVVIMPSLTFMAGANMTELLGARPIFYDVTHQGLLPGVEELNAVLGTYPGASVKAVIVCDYAGNINNHKAIYAWCKERSIQYIIDACHSLGATTPEPYTSMADAVVYSFHPAKVITTGEGGAYCTRLPLLSALVREFRNHGITDRIGPYYDCFHPGMNYRMPASMARLGEVQLKSIEERIEYRHRLYFKYMDLFGNKMPHDLKKYCTIMPHTVNSAFNLMVVRCPEIRDQMFAYLWDEGIKVSMHYPPTHKMLYYVDKYREVHLPETERFAQEAITLPLFYPMPADLIDHVVLKYVNGVKQYTARPSTEPRHNDTPVAVDATHQLYSRPLK
jgi:dTDP-4-amino-4,6-dideoxygalactose transaminase